MRVDLPRPDSPNRGDKIQLLAVHNVLLALNIHRLIGHSGG